MFTVLSTSLNFNVKVGCFRELFDGNFHKLQIQLHAHLALSEVPPST